MVFSVVVWSAYCGSRGFFDGWLLKFFYVMGAMIVCDDCVR